MNLGAAKIKARKLKDTYSKNGTISDPNDVKQKNDTYKMNDYFDFSQKQIATIKKIVKAKHISHNMPLNALSQPLYQFDIVQFIGTDQTYTATGARAYYFEVDDVATVYIEEQINGVWTVLSTLTNVLANAGQFTAYKGLITPTSLTNSIRIRFSGTNFYNHRNRALFTVLFSDVSRIPNYKKYVLYTMPTDFYQFNKLVLKGQIINSQPYENTADFYWEQENILAINYNVVAEYSAEYFAYPSTIDDTTLDTYNFEISTTAQEGMPLYVASQLLMFENNAAGDRLLSQYENFLANLDSRIAVGANSVSNSLFTGSSTNTKLF